MPEFLSLRNYVYNNITRMIQRGELKPGEKVSELFVCEKLGISRTPVREALIQLATDGILENSPRKGFIVRKADGQRQNDTYEMQGMLDSFAAYLACPLLTEDDFSTMHQLIEQMDIAIKYKKYDDYYDLQERFHGVYASRCGNRMLMSYIEKLNNGAVRSSYYGTDDDDDSLFAVLAAMNREHLHILELFEARDRDGVERELRFNHWVNKYPDKA